MGSHTLRICNLFHDYDVNNAVQSIFVENFKGRRERELLEGWGPEGSKRLMSKWFRTSGGKIRYNE